MTSLLPTKCDKMRAISFDKLYVGDSTNETIGRRGIPCLCILGKPHNLGARPSELFSANSSFKVLHSLISNFSN